jgi:hypothetical protein
MSTYSLEEVLKIVANNNIPNTNAPTETSTNNNLASYNLSPEVGVGVLFLF